MNHFRTPSSNEFPNGEIPLPKYISFGSSEDPIHLYSGETVFCQNENSFSVKYPDRVYMVAFTTSTIYH